MELIIAYISAVIIFTSGCIYTYRAYKGNIDPNIVTWTLFSIIGILVVLTSLASGSKENSIPLIAMAIPPILTTVVIIFKKFEKNFTYTDIICAVLGGITIIIWSLTKEDKNLAQMALYSALIADIIAIIPTVKLAREKPYKDRPGAWILFAIGNVTALFTVTDYTFANYLPIIWFIFGGMFVWIPLLNYRRENNIPIKEWI